MKKTILLTALAMIALSSCTKEPSEAIEKALQKATPKVFEPSFSFEVDGVFYASTVSPDILYTNDLINGTSFIVHGTFETDSTHNTLGLSFNHIELTPGNLYSLKTISGSGSYAYYTEQSSNGLSKWSHSHSKDQGAMKIDSIVNEVLHASFQLNIYSDVDSTFTHSITKGHIKLRLKQIR
jgi:hypothetical protein